MSGFNKLIREDLRGFKGYSSARKESPLGSVFLNANESPWENNVSFDVFNALNRYPEPQPRELIEKLANLYGVLADQILLTGGSDVGIDLVIRLFCDAGKDSIVICPPTYGMYEISARLQKAYVISVNLLKNASFSLDFEGIKKAWNPSVKVIFLCSPNNPTGNLLNKNDIFALCKKYAGKSLIVVDEAYIEYANAESLIKNINQYKNLIILRTFSKALSFAGIRCGVLVAHKDLIVLLNQVISPYPISVLTSQVALQIFSKKIFSKIQTQISLIQSERERLKDFFNQCGWFEKIWSSEANFLLVKSKKSKEILEKCINHGILIRNMKDKPGLKNCIRISIGSPRENDFLIKILR